MKKRILFFLFIMVGVIVVGIYFLKGDRSYSDVLFLTTRVMEKDQQKKSDKKEKELIFISANVPDTENTLNNSRKLSSKRKSSVNKCINKNKNVLFIQAQCPEGYESLEYNQQ